MIVFLMKFWDKFIHFICRKSRSISTTCCKRQGVAEGLEGLEGREGREGLERLERREGLEGLLRCKRRKRRKRLKGYGVFCV